MLDPATFLYSLFGIPRFPVDPGHLLGLGRALFGNSGDIDDVASRLSVTLERVAAGTFPWTGDASEMWGNTATAGVDEGSRTGLGLAQAADAVGKAATELLVLKDEYDGLAVQLIASRFTLATLSSAAQATAGDHPPTPVQQAVADATQTEAAISAKLDAVLAEAQAVGSRLNGDLHAAADTLSAISGFLVRGGVAETTFFKAVWGPGSSYRQTAVGLHLGIQGGTDPTSPFSGSPDELWTFGSRADARGFGTGKLNKAANDFFKSASGDDAFGYKITRYGENYRMEYSDPSNTGYATKTYIREFGKDGETLRFYKQTIRNDDGQVEDEKWLRGGPDRYDGAKSNPDGSPEEPGSGEDPTTPGEGPPVDEPPIDELPPDFFP